MQSKRQFRLSRGLIRPFTAPKQVTDAWLAELARRNQGKVATLDEALAALHSGVVELVP
jgi:predicted nucleic acid-binding protein